MDLELVLDPTGRRAAVAWMVGAFLLTFLTTRLITRAIRTGRGPFRNASVGGIHVHHEVYGIFLLLITGTAELTYGPEGSWLYVLAILFGAGAALTLDEFALWLNREDVYWSQEGRSSIDAVLIALVVGGLLLVGANPFDADRAESEGLVAATETLNLVFALVAILKGRTVLTIVKSGCYRNGPYSRPVLARKPASSAGRYCIRFRRVFTSTVSSAMVCLVRLASDRFRCAQTNSTGLSSWA